MSAMTVTVTVTLFLSKSLAINRIWADRIIYYDEDELLLLLAKNPCVAAV